MNIPALFYKHTTIERNAESYKALSIDGAEYKGQIRAWMRRHVLVSFFALAFGLSWGYELIVLVWLRLPDNPWVFPAAFLGPTLAALAMIGMTEGWVGIVRFLKRYVQWRAGARWYFLALIALPLLVVGVDLIVTGSFSVVGGMVMAFVLNYGTALLVGGPLGEEGGWRGFALPRMQKKMGALGGSVVLGVLWACWHLPTFVLPGLGEGSSTLASGMILFGMFVVSTVALSVLFTWVYNGTQGSVLIAILLHTAINFPALSNTVQHGLVQMGLWGGLALLIVVVTRGRLGYEEESGGMRIAGLEQESMEVRRRVA